MTKEKWADVSGKIFADYTTKFMKLRGDRQSPEGWAEHRELIVTLVKEVDEATEVYNMENKNGNQN